MRVTINARLVKENERGLTAGQLREWLQGAPEDALVYGDRSNAFWVEWSEER